MTACSVNSKCARGDSLYAFAALNLFKEDIDQTNYRGSLALTAAGITNATEGSGAFTSGTAQAYSREYDIHRQVTTLTSGVDYALDDKTKLSAIASYGHSDHNETLYAGSIFTFPGLSGTYSNTENGTNFTLNTNANLSKSGELEDQSSSGRRPSPHLPMTDNIETFRADINHNNFAFSEGFGLCRAASTFGSCIACSNNRPTITHCPLAQFTPSTRRWRAAANRVSMARRSPMSISTSTGPIPAPTASTPIRPRRPQAST